MKATVNSAATGGWRLKAGLMVAMALGLLGVLLLAQGRAQAHDHQIPNTVLKKGAKELQAGTLVNESSWHYPSGENECTNETTWYSTRFPETDSVAAGAKLHVRVSKAQRPDSFFVGTYQEIDENGNPSGQGRLLKRTIERVVRDGKTVAWDVVFSVKGAGRDYYLITEGHWQDREGCGGNDQFASWSFHVKTRA